MSSAISGSSGSWLSLSTARLAHHPSTASSATRCIEVSSEISPTHSRRSAFQASLSISASGVAESMKLTSPGRISPSTTERVRASMRSARLACAIGLPSASRASARHRSKKAFAIPSRSSVLVRKW